MVPLLLIMGFIFYFMLIRPEQKRRKEQEAMVTQIKKGTQVLTSSGIFGVVQDVQGDALLITIDDKNKVTVKMQKNFVVAVIGGAGLPSVTPAPAATPASTDKK